MVIEELWSEADEARAVACASAARAGDLATAMFEIEGTSLEDRAADLALLEAWGERARSRAGDGDEAGALASVLGAELDFRGPEDGYYDAINSHLHAVIGRRRGLPILLSVIWIEVGERAGIEVEGIGLPGHFIARVGERTLVDPFGGGRELEIEDCKRIVRAMTGADGPAWRDDFLAPTPRAQIVERVVQNLVNSGARAGDAGAMFRALSFLVTLRPDAPHDLLRRAVAAESVGARSVARAAYEDIVKRFPGSDEAGVAAERHRAGRGKPALN